MVQIGLNHPQHKAQGLGMDLDLFHAVSLLFLRKYIPLYPPGPGFYNCRRGKMGSKNRLYWTDGYLHALMFRENYSATAFSLMVSWLFLRAALLAWIRPLAAALSTALTATL